jgi:hypothetical protein
LNFWRFLKLHELKKSGEKAVFMKYSHELDGYGPSSASRSWESTE